MITKNNLDQSSGIADNIGYAGKRLTPLAQTPLAGLVESIGGVTESCTNSEILELSCSKNTTTGSHGELQADIVAKASGIIGNVITVARNDVNPKIKALIAAVEEARVSHAEQAGLVDINISQVEMYPLYTDSVFLELLAPYKNSNDVIGSSDIDGVIESLDQLSDCLTTEEIADLAITGSPGLDERAAEIIQSTLGHPQLLTEAYKYNLPIARIIGAFLVISGALNGRSEKCDGLLSNELIESKLILVRAFLARIISKRIERLAAAIRNGEIIAVSAIDGDQRNEQLGGRVIRVIGPVYRNWLANQGGSVEAVIGYGHSLGELDYSSASAKLLKTEPQKFVKLYEAQLSHGKNLAAANEISVVRKVIIRCVIDDIRAVADGDEALISNLKQRLMAFMDSRPYLGKVELVSYLRDLVCAVFTDGDDVRSVLVEMDSVLAEMETPDRAQAVYIAVNRIVARWVLSQAVLGE